MQTKWAVCVNMAMNKALAASVVSQCVATVICFGERGEPGASKSQFTVYLITEKVRTTFFLLKCKLQSQMVAGAGCASCDQPASNCRAVFVSFPLVFLPSHEVISAYYDSVKAGRKVGLFAMGVTQFGDPTDGNILVGVGPFENIMSLGSISSTFAKRVSGSSKQTKAKAAAATKSEQSQEDDADDVANDGLNLLLEHAQEQDQEGSDADVSMDPNQDVDPSAEADLAERIIASELELGVGPTTANESAQAAATYADELARATDELTALQQEQKIIDEVKASSSAKFLSAQHIESSPFLSYEEAIDEAILNDIRVCGNQEGVLGDVVGVTDGGTLAHPSAGPSRRLPALSWRQRQQPLFLSPSNVRLKTNADHAMRISVTKD